MAGNPPFNTKLRVAAAYYQMNRDTLARNLYKQLVAVNSADGEAVGGLLSVYHRMGEIQEAHNLLEEWLKLHPNDAQAKQRLQEYKNILSAG
ncbi:MAG: tetratricopeptide repeat protein [FCB group bacterium]|nr:tetratricopeptide repeat protein [FCB group bacterium]